MQGDDSTERIISMAITAKLSGDNEQAMRVARGLLRQVQKDKKLANRTFYLTLAKAVNAYCCRNDDRTQSLLQKIADRDMAPQSSDEEALVVNFINSLGQAPHIQTRAP